MRTTHARHLKVLAPSWPIAFALLIGGTNSQRESLLTAGGKGRFPVSNSRSTVNASKSISKTLFAVSQEIKARRPSRVGAKSEGRPPTRSVLSILPVLRSIREMRSAPKMGNRGVLAVRREHDAQWRVGQGKGSLDGLGDRV